MVKILVITCL